MTLLLEVEQSFISFTASVDHPTDAIIFDTTGWQRYDCPFSSKGNQNVSYKAHSDGRPCIKIQCHKCFPKTITYKLEIPFSQIQIQKSEMLRESEKRKIAQQREYEIALTRMRAKWDSAIPCVEHPYFARKCLQVEESDDLRVDSTGKILCPIRLITGELIDTQSIPNEGKKKFYYGLSPKNGFHIFGSIEDGDDILLAEGIATSLTIRKSLNKSVICVYGKHFNDIAQVIAKAYPNTNMVYCCDLASVDEKYTSQDNAKKAVALIGGNICLPDFSMIPSDVKPEIPRSDFNDLFVLLLANKLNETAALDIVRQQIKNNSIQGNFMLENHAVQTNINKMSNISATGCLDKTFSLNIIQQPLILEPIPHREILDQLLGKVFPIDFRKLAKLAEDEKIRNNHFQIITIEQILELAKQNNWGICKNHEFIYLYNGAYWSLVTDERLKTFLGESAEKLGVDEFRAKHFNFRDQLYKQFMAVANLPKPEQSKDAVLINLKNGTFEITPEGTQLKPFDRLDFITYQLPFEYNPQSKAPLFEKYLNEVLPDKKLQMILSEYLGYIFIRTSTLKLEKTLILYGKGANGKSVLYEIVRNLLGEQNTSEYSLQSLTDESGYYRAMIANKLANYATEINGRLEASIFKQLVSGEPVEARFPFGRPFTLEQYAKFIFNCNELPKDVEQTDAYYRRFLIIPFNVTIPEHQQDKQLAQKIIKAELSGVFNWVLEGLSRLLKHKQFTASDVVSKAREQYERESDSVRLFIDEKGYKPSRIGIRLKLIYDEYKVFCIEDGYKPLNKTDFQKRLASIKIVLGVKDGGNIVYLEKNSFN